jgi:hypothetical protein
VALSVLGLVLLAVSLAHSSGGGERGSTAGILAWLGGTAALAALVLLIGRHKGALAVAEGVAGGLLFSIGDFSTKLATQGGTRLAFVMTLIIGYTLGPRETPLSDACVEAVRRAGVHHPAPRARLP